MANGIELPRCDERLVQSLLVTFLRTNNGCKLIERDGRLHTMIIHKLQQRAKLKLEVYARPTSTSHLDGQGEFDEHNFVANQCIMKRV